MTAIAICTDSTSLLTGAVATQLGVDVVPSGVTLEGRRLDDDVSVGDFYRHLRADARTASFGVAVCVRAAAEKAASGASPSVIAAAAARLGESMRNVFVVRGSQRGRIAVDGRWSVLAFADGVTSRLAEYGTVGEAIGAIAQRARGDESPIRVAVGHAAGEVEGAADEPVHRLSAEPGVVGIERYRVGPPVGAHTGPDCFGIFWWPAR